MKLSLAAVFLFATSVLAAAVPNHAARASYALDIAELQVRIQQLEHEVAMLVSVGEIGSAQQRNAEIELLKSQLAGYQASEANNVQIWGGIHSRDTHEPRASFVVNIMELQERIRQLEHERNILFSVGETEAANRKGAEIDQLKVQLASYQSTEDGNADIWAGIGKRNAKRQSSATTFQEVQDEIAELIEQIVALQASGDTEEAAELHRELDQLRAMGDSYADAERLNYPGRK
ncbi:hypothetical protein A1Q2_00150 [Trichosporon asahii var. asahii CBS 8904]|uniref:Uncharacterized protein n=1 Tax=Trichosporon asahii var. asahii (strain CBS 8904) TaxID=1220162 RepID=K1VY58_TRIAC|nr:hypothetical protein A1Q2_00150 [Trichosporon asahii var. asahii CBS 8904]